MIEYLLDTNVLLRFLIKDIPEQVFIIRTYFEKAKKGEITLKIPLLVFPEIIFTLMTFYKFPKSVVVEKLLYTTQVSYIDIEKRDILISTLLTYSKLNLSFVDLCLYFQAQHEGKELLTFDKKLQKLAKAIAK